MLSEDVLSEEVSSEEVSPDEVLSEVVLSDEVSSDEVLSEDVLSDEVLSDGVLSDDVSSEEVLSDDVLSDEVSSDEVVSDDVLLSSGSDEVGSARIDNESEKTHRITKSKDIIILDCFIKLPLQKNILIMNCSDFLFDDIYNSFEFEDYSYWNNTDKPEDVSVREWNKRFKVWEEICPDCPANNSLMYNPHFNQVKNFPFLWKYEDLKEYFEKYNAEKRFERYTRNHEFANEYTGKYKPNPWIEVKEKMITINEKNFNDVFDCVEDKK